MSRLFLSYFVLINLFSHAQNKIDSLESILRKDKKDTIWIDAAVRLAVYLRNSDINRAAGLSAKSLKLSEELKYRKGIGMSKINLGTISHLKSDYPAAEVYYNEALIIFEEEGMKNEQAKCYNNLGNLYQLKGDFEKALKYLLKSQNIAEKSGYKRGVCDSELNIGNIYLQKRDFHQAISHFRKSLKITEEFNDVVTKSQVLNNLGAVYRLMNLNDTALIYYKKSLAVRISVNDKVGIAENYLNIGDASFHLRQLDSAFSYFNRAYGIYKEIGHKIGIAYTLNNIASVLCEQMNNKAALDTFISASLISESIGAKDLLAENCKNIAEIYFSMNNYRQSAIYQKKYSLLRDTILNEHNQKQIAEMQIKYDTERKEKEIIVLNYDKQLKDIEIKNKAGELKQQKVIIYIILSGFLIILVFSMLLYKQYKEKKQANRILAIQNTEIMQKNEEISTQRDEIEAQRDEIASQRDLVTLQKERIEEIHETIQSSIRYAQRIQYAMLPDSETLGMLLGKHFILFMPRDIVSGDFYWTAIRKNWLMLAVADCTGHGVPGAFMSMLGISYLNEIVAQYEHLTSSEMLERLRNQVIKSLKQTAYGSKKYSGHGQAASPVNIPANLDVKDGMDISLIQINLETYEMQFAGANNPVYIVKDREYFSNSDIKANVSNEQPVDLARGSFENPPAVCTIEQQCVILTELQDKVLIEIKGDKMPIAVYEEMTEFRNYNIVLNSGNTIYLSSDGYSDQFGGMGNKKFNKKQLKNTFIEFSSEEMDIQKIHFENKVNEWKGNNEQTDDITLVGIKII